MNDSQEHADVPMQPQAPPVVPPPVPPAPAQQAALPPPAVGYGLPGAAAGRVQGLQHKSPFIACVLSLMPGVGQIYVGYYKLGFIHNVVFASAIMLLTTRLPDPMYPLLSIFLAFFFIYNIVRCGPASHLLQPCARRGGGHRAAEHAARGTELRRLVRRRSGDDRTRCHPPGQHPVRNLARLDRGVVARGPDSAGPSTC